LNAGDTSPHTPKPNPAKSMVPFSSMEDFELSNTPEPRKVNRAAILATVRDIFGSDDDNADLVAKLVDNLVAVAESRRKIATELVALGGNLSMSYEQIRNRTVAKMGDTVAAHRKAATLAFDVFEQTLQISRPAARNYMRIHQRFGDDAEALRVFNNGELQMLAGDELSDTHFTALIAQKIANPKMTREQLKEVLDLLKKQDELLDDKNSQLQNVESLLEDSKVQLEVAESEAKHMKDQITAFSRQLAEKEASLTEMRDFISQRSNAFASMEKALADKTAELKHQSEEFQAKDNEKPKIEEREVFVDRVPEPYANMMDAMKATTASVQELMEQREVLVAEVAQLEEKAATQKAQIDAETAVQEALKSVVEAWEPFSAKFSLAQLAMQATTDPEPYRPALEALAAMIRKFLAEIDSAL
jgi:DNA repair exonuclease SbcCD ATPase subunit